MKLLLALVSDTDAESILEALTSSQFRVTRISSTGGFLRRGQTTLLIGVEEEKVQQCIQIIRESSAPVIDTSLKRVTIFVMKMDHYEQI